MTSRILRSSVVVLLFAALSVRGGEEKRCNATAQECEREIRRMLSGRRYLGLQVVGLEHGGIVVKTVNEDTPAKHAGFIKYDRIIGINGRDMTLGTVRDFKQALADAAGFGGRLFVIIQRRGVYQKIDVTLVPYPQEQINKIIEQHLLQSHPTQQQMQQQQK